tara:strand:- start:244 stop:579 length:336 start_codon:yes stop_codon:yes gene_type:complete
LELVGLQQEQVEQEQENKDLIRFFQQSHQQEVEQVQVEHHLVQELGDLVVEEIDYHLVQQETHQQLIQFKELLEQMEQMEVQTRTILVVVVVEQLLQLQIKMEVQEHQIQL